MNTFIVNLVVRCRLLLIPLFLGLILALLSLVVFTMIEVWQLLKHLLHMNITETEFILAVLSLIDLTLIGSLMVVMVYSGYENFITKIDYGASDKWPEWMTRVSFSGLKLQFFASMMAISGVTLLKALVKLETSVSETQVKWLVVANLVFAFCYAVLAYTHRTPHSHADGH